MKNKFWRRRMSLLLALAMLFAQLSVPEVYAGQGDSQSPKEVTEEEAPQTVEIPQEYISLNEETVGNIVDLSDVKEPETQEPEAQAALQQPENDVPEEYKNIPVVGEKTGENGQDAPFGAETFTDVEAVLQETAPAEEMSPEPALIPYIDGETVYGEEDMPKVQMQQDAVAFGQEAVEPAVPENTIGTDEFVQGEILIGNEPKEYSFTPQETGAYIVAAWADKYFNMRVTDVTEGNMIQVLWLESYNNDSALVQLTQGTDYKLEITSPYQCVYHIAVLKAASLEAGTSAEVTAAARLTVGETGKAQMVKLNVASSSGNTYHVAPGGREIAVSEDGSCQFLLVGSQEVLFWKENADADTLTITQTVQDEIGELVMADGAVRASKTVPGTIIRYEGDYSDEYQQYVKFTPEESGKYYMDCAGKYQTDSGTAGTFTGSLQSTYVLTGDGFQYEYKNAYCAELEGGKTYLFKFTGHGNHNSTISAEATVLISKLQEESISLGTENEIQPKQGQYIYVELPEMEFGAYDTYISGQQDYYLYSNKGIFSYGRIEVKNGRKTTKVLYNDTNDGYMIIAAADGKELDNLKISIKESTVDVEVDDDSCWRQPVTLNSYEEKWYAFTPTESGSYVFCTEEKYSNNYTYIYLYEKKGNSLEQKTEDRSRDNNHLAYELTAGTTYYYHLYRNEWGDEDDSFAAAVYPEKTVSLTDRRTSTDAIRKSVAYQVTIPRAGFYNLGVSGKDASYPLKIQNADEEDVNSQSFVYNGIKRSFLFKKAGTYTIWVIKEIMGDEPDEITFTYEEGAASARLESGKNTEMDMDSTDGVWLEFTPGQTGWYALDVQSTNYINSDLSVLSVDGSEIVWGSTLSYVDWDEYDEDSDTDYENRRFYAKLEQDRTYYYNVGDWSESTGHIIASMGGKAQEFAMETAEEKEINAPEKLFVLKTNFEEPQLLGITGGAGKVCVCDITDSIDGYSEYIYDDDCLYVPKGQREYLIVCKGSGEPQITIKPHTAENIQSKVSVQFTEEKQSAWLKFKPQKDGFYVLYADKASDIDLYYETDNGLNNVRGTSNNKSYGKGNKTALLETDKTYYYKVSPYDGKMAVEYTLSYLDGGENSFSLGDNELSISPVWFGKSTLTESGYYTAKIKSGAEKAYMSWITADENEISKKKEIVLTQEEETFYIGMNKTGRVNNYVQIFADSDVEISLEKTETDAKTIRFGDSITEEASPVYREYHFTPETSGTYTFVLTSGELPDGYQYRATMVRVGSKDKVKSARGKSAENLAGTGSRYSLQYKLTAGREYIFYVLEKEAYTLNLTETTDKYVYDYDYYEAFIASGGTIQLVDSFTDEMWDDFDNGYADFDEINNQYLFYNAKNFENLDDIWFPGWNSGEYDRITYYGIRDEEFTYQNILDNVNQKEPKIYKVTDLYRVNPDDAQESAKADLAAKLSASEQVILAKYIPSIILIQSIELDGLTAMEIGQKAKVTATTSTGNEYAPTNPNVVFTSSDSSVLAVDGAGNVEAKKGGTAKVICTSADGNASAELTVRVGGSVVCVEKVTISGAREISVGDSIRLVAATDTNGKGKPTVDGVNWSSSDTSIATVDADGTVTGLKEGSVTITAASKDGNAKGSVTIQVKAVLAKSISIKDSKILMKKGTTYKWLEYTFNPANTTDKTVTLSSSNHKVVAITASGDLKAKAVGTAVITAKTKNGKSDTVKVTVTASDVKVKKLKLDKKAKLMVGEKLNLKPVFTPVNATNQKLEYTSSNTDVATVSSKGIVTTKKEGKATITAKTKDGSGKTAKCKITVTGPGKVSISKIDNSQKGEAALSWKEVEEADGYEIYMSTDKKEYKKIQTIKGASVTTFTKKKLKSNTTYYFKVVSYVNIGKGKKAYGKESKAVKVKIK